MAKKYIIIQTSTNKENISRKISSYLLEKNLAACINVVFPVYSQYKYKGEVKEDTEYVLYIKTKKDNYFKIQKAIEELHNYQTPEIIALEISQGCEKFLQWIDNETNEKNHI